MEMRLPRVWRFERSSLFRHLAICLAAAAACVFHEQVRAGNGALWIIGLTAAINLGITLVAERPRWTRLSVVLSPCFGLAGWAILVHLTGGASSLFVPGFGLEIVLSAWTCAVRGTLLVTGGAAAALWAQQGLLGAIVPLRLLILETVFLTAMGGVTILVTRQWERTQWDLSRRHLELMNRLRTIEDEMETLRVVGEVGENVARLAHALKNAIHSLRGFAALLDPRHAGPDTHAKAFDGLWASIDRLEEIVRITLGSPGSVAVPQSPADRAETRRVIEETLEEVSLAYPRVGWQKSIGEPLPPVCVHRAMLREVLLNLTRNAAEAMHGSGEVAIEAVVEADHVEVRIRDHGSGLTQREFERTLKPGFTTKPGGSGFGLFLARRIVESHGGRLTAEPANGGGVIFSVGLPLQERRPS